MAEKAKDDQAPRPRGFRSHRFDFDKAKKLPPLPDKPERPKGFETTRLTGEEAAAPPPQPLPKPKGYQTHKRK
ncbi:MAG: hypothetical protein HYZ53_21860 [Planctomycetes bacterium]|nr:hypothetical protein [Planctomycetota bacterium]